MTDLLDVSPQGIHSAINQLLEAETVLKFGRTPKTIYRLAPIQTTIMAETLIIDPEKHDFLAQHFLVITETVKYKHILLIDDAVGSGSTLNQIAGKIKKKGVAQKVTGLAIVGSFKGFDVVTDV